MTRASIIVATVLGVIAAPSLLSTLTTPAAAQEQEWSSSDMSGDQLRGILQNWVRERPDRRDLLMNLLQERRDRRADIMDRLDGRMNRRERLRERISSRLGDDEDGGSPDRRDLRDRLRERLADTRGGGDCYVITRSLSDEDRTLFVVVRRRVCRD